MEIDVVARCCSNLDVRNGVLLWIDAAAVPLSFCFDTVVSRIEKRRMA